MSVAIYARVSSEEQAERGTIENQLEFAHKYCDLHQLQIADWYKDDGITGTITLDDREEGRRLMEDAQAKRFDLILVYRLDRLGRSARIILNAVYELEQYGVKIRSMTEPFDTGDPSGRFLLTILAGVADLERETILDRMWNGANRAARAGKWLGGIVPYGYYLVDKQLTISEEPLHGCALSEKEVVQLIYRLTVDQHMSTIKLADYLNALGVPPSYTKDGRQITKGKRKENTSGIWRPARIRGIITNTTYKGIHQYGKRSKKQRDIISREVPAIVDEATWDRAQIVLKENQLDAVRNAKRQYLLRGLLKCGICGLNLSGSAFKGPGNKPKGYYICNGKIAYSGITLGKCNSKNVPQIWIEEVVWADIIRFVNDPEEVLNLLTKDVETRKSNIDIFENEKETLRHTLMQKEAEKQSILDLFRKKLINNSDVEIQLNRISRESDGLRGRLSELENSISAEENLEHQHYGVIDLLNNLRKRIHENIMWDEKREIVKGLVKRIVVNSNLKGQSSVSIEYMFLPTQIIDYTDKDSYRQLH